MTTKPSRPETSTSPIVQATAGWQPTRVPMAADRLDVFNVVVGEFAYEADSARSRPA